MAFVQSAHGRATSGAVALAFSSGNTLHNLLLAAVTLESNTDTVTSLVSSAGGTWVATSAIVPSISAISGQLYCLKDCPAGANTVTLTPSGGASNLEIHEYSGYDLTAPLGQHIEATSSGGTAVDSGNVTTTTANELLFALVASNRSITVGSGYTLRESDAFNIFNITEDQVAVSAGTFSATATLATAGTWVVCLASFKLAGGGGVAVLHTRTLLGAGG